MVIYLTYYSVLLYDYIQLQNVLISNKNIHTLSSPLE